jgi:enoyl-[acyl-carrier protein] reductase II
MNKLNEIFKIKYPVIQGGMVWCSGWELASAVSNAGGLGLIGAGSMTADILEQHIQKILRTTQKPYGVNIPLIKDGSEKLVDICLQYKVPVIFTSAGNPAKYTEKFKSKGATVVHVVSNKKFALKARDAGVDAIVAEGFEAGGHNGREETTTLNLIQIVRKAIDIPLIAAGGISTGKAMLAAMLLGADGVQIGSLFAASEESSAHENFKNSVVEAVEGSTQLSLKKLTPVRMIKNQFFERINAEEYSGASPQKLLEILGAGRSRKGIFEGDLTEGELEIGQVAAMINAIKPVSEIMEQLISEYKTALNEISNGMKRYSF